MATVIDETETFTLGVGVGEVRRGPTAASLQMKRPIDSGSLYHQENVKTLAERI